MLFRKKNILKKINIIQNKSPHTHYTNYISCIPLVVTDSDHNFVGSQNNIFKIYIFNITITNSIKINT